MADEKMSGKQKTLVMIVGMLLLAITTVLLLNDPLSRNECTSAVMSSKKAKAIDVEAETVKIGANAQPKNLEELTNQSQLVIDAAVRLCNRHRTGLIDDDAYDLLLAQLIQSFVPGEPLVSDKESSTDVLAAADTQPVQDTQPPAVQFTAHVESFGDIAGRENAWVGTTGSAKRMEGFSARLIGAPEGLNLEYMCHAQGTGDSVWLSEGQFCGSRGNRKRVEGLGFRMTGERADEFDVLYECHTQSLGTLSIRSNGEYCGTRGRNKRLEAFKVSIVRKDKT